MRHGNPYQLVKCLGLAFVILLPTACPARSADAVRESQPLITVEFFYEPGCSVCERVKQEIIPVIQHRYPDLCVLEEYDTGLEENYRRLAPYLDALPRDTNPSAIIVVNQQYVFAGWKSIDEGLLDQLDLSTSRMLDSMEPSLASSPDHNESPGVDSKASFYKSKLQKFTWLGVAAAGLIDGINPCAISTLVFLISILAVFKVRGRRLLLVGAAFCAASFVTYILIGFGLFRLLYLFSGFPVMKTAIETAMIGVLCVLSFISFRDALRFKRSARPEDISLQLPRKISRLIHRLIRHEMQRTHLFWAGIASGASVTIFESVCTGQVYVPTMIYAVKSGITPWQATGYLLLYNVLFICPLVVALGLTFHGLETQRLLKWSKKNVVISKILLGVLFAGLAALIWLL